MKFSRQMMPLIWHPYHVFKFRGFTHSKMANVETSEVGERKSPEYLLNRSEHLDKIVHGGDDIEDGLCAVASTIQKWRTFQIEADRSFKNFLFILGITFTNSLRE
jgi:hypothetical protein